MSQLGVSGGGVRVGNEVRGHRGCRGPADGTTGGYDKGGPRGWKEWMLEGGQDERLTERQSEDEWLVGVDEIEQRMGSQCQGGVPWLGSHEGW